MSLLTNYREVLDTPTRRRVLLALSSSYLLVQVASFPVALALPSIADDFLVGLDTAAWVLIAELLMLGITVFLAAKLGDRYGHNRMFFLGVVVTTLGAGAAGFSQELTQLVIFRGVQGVGAAFVTGNANAILAGHFPPGQRGRAFALPITAARAGTFLGLIIFATFLQFIGWRAVFFAFIPLGAIALWTSYPMLRIKEEPGLRSQVPIDYIGAVLFIGTLGVLILSGLHIHSGEESFASNEALRYHVPMHILFLFLLAVFILVERRIRQPFVELNLFKEKQFSMALFSNTTFHLSMLAIMTLVPILVEDGFGYGPLFVIYVLLPHQSLGLFVPIVAGWYYDKYNPRLMRPLAMTLIALGIGLLGVFALRVPFWFIPLLLFPASVGTSIFNTINNTVIMNSLAQEHRSFASGMIETTRQVGHTLGVTIAASALGLILPASIALLTADEAYGYYLRGFQASALAVVGIIMVGALVAFQHRPSQSVGRAPAPQPSPSGDGN